MARIPARGSSRTRPAEQPAATAANQRPKAPRATASRAKAARAKSTGRGDSTRSELVRFVSKPWVIAPLVLVLLVSVFAIFYWQPLKIYYRELREAKVAEMQLIAIRDYNEDLRAEIASLETTAGIVEYAQRSLGLTKKGDHVIVVYQNGEPLSAAKGAREANLVNLASDAAPFGAWTGFLDRLLLNR